MQRMNFHFLLHTTPNPRNQLEHKYLQGAVFNTTLRPHYTILHPSSPGKGVIGCSVGEVSAPHTTSLTRYYSDNCRTLV